MKNDLDKFLQRQLVIAATLPDRIMSQFDKDDLSLTQALDITASVGKSSSFLDYIFKDLDRNTPDESILRDARKLQLIWRRVYDLAQTGTDRLMVERGRETCHVRKAA